MAEVSGEVTPMQLNDAVSDFSAKKRALLNHLAITHSGALPLEPGFNVAKTIPLVRLKMQRKSSTVHKERIQVEKIEILPLQDALELKPELRGAWNRLEQQHSATPGRAGVTMVLLECLPIVRMLPALILDDVRKAAPVQIFSPDDWKDILNK